MLYGEYGTELLASALGVPAATWRNYESGVIVPGYVVLRLIVTTKVNPLWLLTGEGEEFEE
jgi:hypothetical protein